MHISLTKIVTGLVDMVADEQLQQALTQGFIEAHESVLKIEKFYELLSTSAWSDQLLARLFNSWKATHLKMLAIYGLSCRLQRLALVAVEDRAREQLLLASTYNAETSYEDLGLDYDGETHAELYDTFARIFLSDFPWQLEQHCSPKAREFKEWIYRNMVVDDIAKGLLMNMFSEIYNHGEYTIALQSFSKLIDQHYAFSCQEKEEALRYINVHVAGETEVAHFLVVVKAIDEYTQATNTTIDYEQAKQLFKEYLTRLGTVMDDLVEEMRHQRDEATILCVS